MVFHYSKHNGLYITRAAPIDGNDVRAHQDTKIAASLSPHSGAGWNALLGR
jgi:hypothetical protein